MAETWILNSTLNYISTTITNLSATLNLSDGSTCTSGYIGVCAYGDYPIVDYEVLKGVGTDRYIWTGIAGDNPTKQSYYVISVTFETSPTGDLLTWLQANAVKQVTQLTTPTLSISSNTLTVSNIDDNATSIKLKKNGVDYKTLYKITDTYTNVTASSHDTLIASDGTMTINLSANGTTYKLPQSVSVSGATGTYTRTSDTNGTLVLSNVTGNITIVATAIQIFTINPTCTNVTASASNPTTIDAGGTAVLTFTADGTSYKVPESMPTITGATGTYNRISDTQCTITLTNPTSNVSFTVVGEVVSSGYTVTFNVASWESMWAYSLDNGSSYTDIEYGATTSLSNVTQIKFRVGKETGEPLPFTPKVTSSTLGLELTSFFGFEYSSNYTLTQNITDVICSIEMG